MAPPVTLTAHEFAQTAASGYPRFVASSLRARESVVASARRRKQHPLDPVTSSAATSIGSSKRLLLRAYESTPRVSPRPRSDRTVGVDDRSALTQARSMLVLLLAACKQTQTVLEAAANALDTDLTNDLGLMIERTEAELHELTQKINALPA